MQEILLGIGIGGAIGAITGLVLGFKTFQSFSQSTYKAALRVKQETIDDLTKQVRHYKGKLGAYIGGPPEITGLGDIVGNLPKWLRPFVEPLVEQFTQNPEQLQALIQKFIAQRSEAKPEELEGL